MYIRMELPIIAPCLKICRILRLLAVKSWEGKRDTTSEAGHCLASFAQIYDREYILVTAGAPADATGVPHLLDAKTIYNRLGEAVAAKQG